MKVLSAVLVISLATTCQATCMPCRNYQLLLLQGAKGLQEQIFIQWGESVSFHCTSNFNITQGRILINGSTPDLESIKLSKNDLTIILKIFNITQALNGAILWCEANFSTSCEVCTSNNISLHILEAATEPPGTPHLPEPPPTSSQSTSSEEIVADDEANVEVNVTENTLTDTSTAVRTSYKIVLPTVITSVFVILVLIITSILCYKVIKPRLQKGKIQSYVFRWCGGHHSLNGGTSSTDKTNEVAALNKVEDKHHDQDDPQYRVVTDPLLQPPENTLSDTDTKQIKDTLNDTTTGQHGTNAMELCRVESAVNRGNPVLEDDSTCEDKDSSNVLKVAANQAETCLDNGDPLQAKSTAKDDVDSSQGIDDTQKETWCQDELVLNDNDSNKNASVVYETGNSEKLHVSMETNQESGSKTVYNNTPVSKTKDLDYEYLQEPTIHPQDKELTFDENALAVPPQAQVSGSTKSDLPKSTTAPPRAPRGSATHRSGTESTQMPHGSSETSAPEDSGSSGARKSDKNGSADSDRMGDIGGMELLIIDTIGSVNELSIKSDQNVYNFSSTTEN